MPHQVNGRKTVILKIEFWIMSPPLATVVFIIIFSNLYFKVRFLSACLSTAGNGSGVVGSMSSSSLLPAVHVPYSPEQQIRFPHIRFLYLRLLPFVSFEAGTCWKVLSIENSTSWGFGLTNSVSAVDRQKPVYLLCLFVFLLVRLKETKSKEFTQPYQRTCTDINQETDGCQRAVSATLPAVRLEKSTNWRHIIMPASLDR